MAMTFSRRTLLVASAGVTAALLLAAPSEPTEAQGSDVLVFAAASLKTALDAVNAQWTKETGKKAVISYASSSALAKQIEQGAPAQMFISADLDWMDYLAAKSLIKPDTRSNLLGNRIVLIAPKDKAQPVEIKPGFDLAKRAGRRTPVDGQRRRRPGRQVRQGCAGEARACGPASRAKSRRPRTCAPRCCWSRAARRRPASSIRRTPRQTPTSRSSARFPRTRTRRSSIPSP